MGQHVKFWTRGCGNGGSSAFQFCPGGSECNQIPPGGQPVPLGEGDVCMCQRVRAHSCVWIHVCTPARMSTDAAAEEATLLVLGKLMESHLMKV